MGFCEDNNVKRSVLFVLDTSGSIGQQDFQRMTNALSTLTPFFCAPVQFALMTFSSRRWLEFCFDCFDNTLAGQNATRQAIANTVYHGGSTHSGKAARYACNELINMQKCGLFPSSCIDVVFITDGQSNGPLNVCEEVKCLHDNQEMDFILMNLILGIWYCNCYLYAFVYVCWQPLSVSC